MNLKRAYHASPQEFSFPDYDLLIENRTNHPNGELGLWCAVQDHWVNGFGKHVYTVDYNIENVLLMDSIDFRDLCQTKEADNDPEYFKTLRKKLIKDGYSVLEIVESSEKVDMLIILDFNAIESFEKRND